MKMKIIILIVGMLGGAAVMHFSGGPIRQAVGLEGREVEARVLEENRDEDGRLVLMLESEGESMLATFRDRADDVASLVEVGDVVSFRAPINGVFSDDVPLLSVRRGDSEEGSDEEDEEGSDEELSEEDDAEDLEGEEPPAEEAAVEGADSEVQSEEEPTEPTEPSELGPDEEADAPLPLADTGASDPESAES